LADSIKVMLVEGRLSAGHARALLAAPEEHRVSLAQRAAKEGLTVRALERLAASGGAPKNATAARELSADDRNFEGRLRERFGTHVALVRQKRGGRIEFRFVNDDELMRLGDLLAANED
jgi:ParB family chromosome partitioning protein